MAGVSIPEGIDGKSFYNLFSGQKQESRETVFVHYDPLKKGRNERWYGRFVRNKTYKLYSNDRFYNVSEDSKEKIQISETDLTNEEKQLKRRFQAELNTAPPHYFKQSKNYKKKK